jgi:serine/threonine-protein kinase
MQEASGRRRVPNATAPTRACSGPFGIGETICDSYRIDRILGAGGMGAVYEAIDLNLPRRVAVKAAIHPAFTHSLHNEAQALAAIRHPSFPTLHHFGRHEETPFLVMERVYGETLSCRLERRANVEEVSITEALETLLGITVALAAAHSVGVAHRDLKPANVILAGERIVLVDLGLFIPEVLVSHLDVPAGSIDSIAPEVILSIVEKGEGHLVDLYALGVLAFELLTGDPPFVGDTIEGVLAQHVGAPIPDPTGVRSGIPPSLGDLVRDLLAKDPRDRPQSASEVHQQLEAVLRSMQPWLSGPKSRQAPRVAV